MTAHLYDDPFSQAFFAAPSGPEMPYLATVLSIFGDHPISGDMLAVRHDAFALIAHLGPEGELAPGSTLAGICWEVTGEGKTATDRRRDAVVSILTEANLLADRLIHGATLGEAVADLCAALERGGVPRELSESDAHALDYLLGLPEGVVPPVLALTDPAEHTSAAPAATAVHHDAFGVHPRQRACDDLDEAERTYRQLDRFDRSTGVFDLAEAVDRHHRAVLDAAR